MNIPEYKPLRPVSPHSSREANLRQYGPAPVGWRWKKKGEDYEVGDLMVGQLGWNAISNRQVYSESEWPAITPVEVRPAPDTNLLNRGV